MSIETPRLPVAVRSYEPRDREAVRTLLTRTFGSPAVFDRYADGNPLGEFVAAVAEHAGAVVGYNMWNPWLLHTADGSLVAYQSGASAVDDSMRGQGIFGKLLRTGEELARGRGVTTLFGFPNPASLPGFLKAGWEHPSSMRLFASVLPSLGVGPLQAATVGPLPPTSAATRFIAWRYRAAGITPRALTLPDGRVAGVYARSERRRGLAVNKLLDVIDGEGRRVHAGLGRVALRLPGPGATLLRAVTPPAALPPFVAVRREWATPIIFKRLAAGAPDAAALRALNCWYGDIDVG